MDQIDALIIAAIPEEFDAAKVVGLTAGVAQWHERDANGTPYLVGNWLTAGRWLRVALARPTRMGGRVIGPLATSLTDLLAPTCLAMCGVCAGNPGETAPGDVVVAEVAYEYDEGRHTGSTIEGDHRQYPLDARWVRAAQDFDEMSLPSHSPATEDEAIIRFLEQLHRRQDPRTHPARERYFPRGTWQPWLERIESAGSIKFQDDGWALTDAGASFVKRVVYDDVDGPQRLPIAVHVGPMASGSAVIRDENVWQRLADMGVRKIAALEMEAATIATVAHERRVPHWLVAKGVMDRADLTKDDRYKRFAARAAAEVLYSLMGRLLPDVHRQTPAAATTALFPGTSKLEICRRLNYDWQDLADLLGIPPHERVRFGHGDGPRGLWEWLEARRRLDELPAALDEIGRNDLAELMRRPLDPT